MSHPTQSRSCRLAPVTGQGAAQWIFLAQVCLFASVCRGQSSADLLTSDSIQNAKKALDYVERVAQSTNCSSGTGYTLPLTFDTTAWAPYTSPAILTANFLSQILIDGNGKLDSLEDHIFYDLVRNNVHGTAIIYGSAVALEPGVHSGYDIFCPYAHKSGSAVVVFDLASSYNYTSNNTEWYHMVQTKNFTNVPIITDNVTYNSSNSSHVKSQPVADLSDGRWTFPYYDCGGGDIWMVTYSAPILDIELNFKGVATIDLELTNIDINQCDADQSSAGGSLDVFRGTHNCQPTTKCVPIPKKGFKRGSYTCNCLDGYYFPDESAINKSFYGHDIDKVVDNVANDSGKLDSYRCLPCPRACDTCVDDTPCLYEFNPAIRVLVVLLLAALIAVCGVLSLFTFKYRKELFTIISYDLSVCFSPEKLVMVILFMRGYTDRVMKTASPIFLQLMVAGSILMSMSVFVMFPEATDVLCTAFIWPFHLGFAILYGALLIKTWRISVIFNSRKKVNLPDKVLLQRLVPLPVIMTIYLVCWTLIGPPSAVMITMANEKKFFSCSATYWNYGAYGAEVFLLLFGVYLCFTVRKAPAHFNESKHITWSTYNAIILGTFIITLTQILERSAGPDVVYVLLMAQLQVFVTITMGLIFVPKLWTLYKGSQTDHAPGGVLSVTGRVKPGSTIPTTSLSVDVRHMGVQVTLEALCSLAAPSNQLVPQEENEKSAKISLAVRSGKVSPSLTSTAKNYSTPLQLLPREAIDTSET